MYAPVEKSKEKKSRMIANSVTEKKRDVNQSFGFVDNRPETVVGRNHQEMMSNSPYDKRIAKLQLMNGNSTDTIQKKTWKWTGGKWIDAGIEGEEDSAAPERDGYYDGEYFDTSVSEDSVHEEEREADDEPVIDYPNLYIHKTVMKNIPNTYYGNIDFEGLNTFTATGTHGKDLSRKPEHIKLAGGYAITAYYTGGKAYITDCGAKHGETQKYKWDISGEVDYQSSTSSGNLADYEQV